MTPEKWTTTARGSVTLPALDSDSMEIAANTADARAATRAQVPPPAPGGRTSHTPATLEAITSQVIHGGARRAAMAEMRVSQIG